MRRDELIPAPPALPPEIATELQLDGCHIDVDLVIRGRGGLFEAVGTDLSPVGALVLVPPPKLDRRFEDCFRTGADVRFPDGRFAIRADLVYSVRGVIDGLDRIVAAFRFRRELSPDECRELGIPCEPVAPCAGEPDWV